MRIQREEPEINFVWVPVENPSDMYGTDKDGKKRGKLYNFSASGIIAEIGQSKVA